MDPRASVLEAIADAVPRPSGAPVRVAIDGPDAAGKTTLRRELAQLLHRRGQDVVEASLDDYHHPREVRYRQGRHSGRGYWEDAFDRQAFLDAVLRPLEAGGNREVRLRHWDLAADAPVTPAPTAVVGDDVTLLADGVFMQHPDLAPYWDAVIFVDAPFSVRFARIRERDGMPEDPQDPQHRRYYDAQLLYRAAVGPRAKATVVIDNTEPLRPHLATR